MRRLPFHRVFLITAILMVAMASVLSAARMAPERGDPELAAFVAIGGSLDDFCSDSPLHEEHRCQFCRLLSDPPDVRIAPSVRRVTLALIWRDVGHLVAHAQVGNPYISARAPPAQT